MGQPQSDSRADKAPGGYSLPGVLPRRLLHGSTLYSSSEHDYVVYVTLHGAEATLRGHRQWLRDLVNDVI